MLDISKIIEKYKKQYHAGPKPAEVIEQPLPASNIVTAGAVSSDKKERFSSTVSTLYAEGLSLAKRIYQLGLEIEKNLVFSTEGLVDKIIQELNTEKKELLALFFRDTPPGENYLCCHALNSCILSIELGLGSGFNAPKLQEIGIAAFLHDVGLIKIADIIMKTQPLSPKERAILIEHPFSGVEMLKKNCPSIPTRVLGIIEQVYEQCDGQGYPRGLTAGLIKEEAQLVGLAQVYETLTHTRPWRERFSPPLALKEILSQKEKFNSFFLKLLIQRMGFYPYGTQVRLNTKEIATVVMVNPEAPFSPTLKITLDNNGRELEPARIINLAETRGAIYIEECVTF